VLGSFPVLIYALLPTTLTDRAVFLLISFS